MKLINSWTKDRVITRIRDRVPTEGCGTPLGRCFYRDDNGKCCPVGAFIPDELYNAAMDSGDGMTVHSLLRRFPELEEHMPFSNDGLARLQVRHDLSVGDSDCLETIVDFLDKEID